MRFAQNSSGRVLWSVMNGRLREEGPESFSFTMTATDTSILLGLLLDSQEEIEKAYQWEQDHKQVAPLEGTYQAVRSQRSHDQIALQAQMEHDATTVP
jgi:hypothetical protein